MRDVLDARPVRGKAPGDQYDRMLDEELEASGSNELAVMNTQPPFVPKSRPLGRADARMLAKTVILVVVGSSPISHPTE